ncbi:hypothetical protein HPB48_008965 [Haemaphysalis longicornis]|uniref:Uncharacterized protein n=1 Tax=Haemaphysalis longicornis TaxID=44386 RepID=A0A9J6GK00_HAELO|nr:hypothetical protein HPB48_008965 [Haemaphysalis longicornis]
MIFIADIAEVNCWLQYREDSALLGVPKKDNLRLLEFKMSLAHYLLSKDRSAAESDDEPPRKLLKV